MKIKLFSHPKDRTVIISNDDVLLMLLDVFGVFDGATDPRGGAMGLLAKVQGFSRQRLLHAIAAVLSLISAASS